ncbi:aldehyde dehydrogenase family protein [Azonexus sp.]|uniref:aldehyde dehydrogenase family protein n=1 Tax=Azonexus sp. TaxID=1872668 RepID=UPI0027B9AE6A|nr:aldehyde dehydrogenase family protein [Azonexus sp.]
MEFAPEGPMAIPLWINGHAYLTMGDSFFDVVNPSTGQALRRVPMCGAEEAAKGVEAARDAQGEWAALGVAARQLCLANLADALARYAGHFAKLLMQDIACEEADATAEVEAAVMALRALAVGDSGVVALVVGAGHPLLGFATAAVPALLAGATMVVKPSPKAPAVAYALCELASRVEWPAGVLNLLHGDGPAIEGLCAAGVDRLVFSGDSELGAQVAALAAKHGTVCELLVA